MGNKQNSNQKSQGIFSCFSKGRPCIVQQDSGNYEDDEKIEKIANNNQKVIVKEKITDLNDKVTCSLKLSTKYIKETTESNTIVPMILSIDVAEVIKKSDTRANIDLICVLDKSGSMRGQKINLLIESFNNIMKYLTDNDRMSIVMFDSTATRLTRLMRMTTQGKANTIRALETIKADGGISITQGVKKALEIIRQRRYPNTVTSVLILSDGLDSSANPGVKNILKEYENKITYTFSLNTFSYGSDHDPVLMSGLAQLRDGGFYFIDKLENVDKRFVDCLRGLTSVVAQNMNISVKTNNLDSILPGIKFKQAFGVKDFWKFNQNENTYSTELLQIISGKNYSYVFEVEIPKLFDLNMPTRSFLVAEANLKFKDLEGETYAKKCECDITFVDEDVNEVDKTVLVEYYRVKTAEVTNQANSLSALKQYDQAKNVLADFKEKIAESEVANDDVVKNYVKDVESAIQNVKPEVYEQIGKHFLCENYAANMNKKSNLNSNNVFDNKRQCRMKSELKAKKAMK
jgi:Mg-chelatase subunit ChlD